MILRSSAVDRELSEWLQIQIFVLPLDRFNELLQTKGASALKLWI
jgi:hypothetical protein